MSETLPAPPPSAINGIAALAPREALARQMMPKPPEPEAPNAAHRRQLERWVGMANIADDPEVADQLETLAARVKSDFDIDDNSRSDWKDKYRKWLDFALQIAQPKTYPWPNASNIIYPLMTTAAIQFAARAYPAIIRDRNVVKGTVIGNDDGIPNPAFAAAVQQMQQQLQGQPPSPQALAHLPRQWQVEPGAKLKRALSIGRHMSWQLLNEQEEWEPQTDTLLIALPIVGTMFRKSYYDPSLRRNVSETVDALALCVNYYARSFETAPRQTESIRMYPNEIETAIRSGLWLDYGDGAEDYGHDTAGNQNDGSDPNQQQDEDAATTFLEQHRRWDLDDDGYAEPYIVTVSRDSGKLARIRAGYEMDGVHWTQDGRVRLIDKIAIYTKYGFIPSPDSKVYDIGFGHLLFPINEAVNTTLNMMFDAGHLQNTGGGFISSSLSMNAGKVLFALGEYKPVNTIGGNIKDAILPLPFQGPNQVLFQLLQFLVEAGERVASVKDVMVGDMPGDNTSGITTLAVIEQGLKVFSAIYKRIHRSLGYEFKKLYRLNRIYGAVESPYQDGGDWRVIRRDDYEKGAGVEPISDPQMVTDMQRLGRAQFMMQFMNDPMMNGKKIRLDVLTAAMIPDAESYINQGPPAPDPKIMLKDRELTIREKREMVDLMLRQEHDKAEILREVAQAEFFLAQARKLDNDAQLGWVEAHIARMKAELGAVADLSAADTLGPGATGPNGAPAAGGADAGAVGPMAPSPGNGAAAGPLPAGPPA